MILYHAQKCLVLLLLVVLLAVPSNSARAEANEERLISVILTGGLERYRTVQEIFSANLAATNVRIYTQTPNPDPPSLANSVRKAVAINSDLIIAYGAQAALIAKKEARSVPVLFADVYDPVSLGLVKCLEDVACNVSGVSASTPLQTLLKTLSDLKPAHRTISALYSSNDPGSAHQCSILEALATRHRFNIKLIDLTTASQLDSVLTQLAAEPTIIFVSESALVQQQLDPLLTFARENQRLVFSQVPGMCDRGAVLTLEPGLTEQGVRLAEYARQVLNGTPTNSLPISPPHKIDLVLNLKVAKAHQLAISLNTLSRATRVVK